MTASNHPLHGWDSDQIARYRADPTIDLVISANCLSQLALLPVERAKKASAFITCR